jgi:hypothetical protein
MFQVAPVRSESEAVHVLLAVSKEQNVTVFFDVLFGQEACINFTGLTDFQRVNDSFLVDEQPDREVFAVLIELEMDEKILRFEILDRDDAHDSAVS